MGCGSDNLWAGKCTWFCCGNKWGPCKSAGSGACGTCRSDRYMGAWPYASENCWDITRPDKCGEKKLPKRGCGAHMRVRHNCSGESVCITVADCGPRTKSFCDAKSCCGETCRTNHIIDLTPAAFAQIGNLDSGHVPVLIFE